MRSRLDIPIVFVLTTCWVLVCPSSEPPDPNQSSKYLDAIREFADNVLKYGRDTYGPKHTPLFVDGLNINTHEPVKWISPKGGDPLTATETEEWILSNFASQQTLLRTLDGLSTLTGDQKYREAAIQATKYAFEHLQAPNGLFYWGHEVAYDSLEDKVRGNGWHTLKLHYPYYELMWAVDPNATKRFIEAFWSAHILDWSNLDMDRGSLIAKRYKNPWNHEYKPGRTFFKGKGIATITTGTSLMYAGTTLYRRSGEEQPLIWSRRLARRYVDTRHPKTGIGATWYNSPWNTIQLGDLKEHFLDPYVTFFPYRLPKNTYFYHLERADAHPWIAFLLIGEMLRDQGREFTLWALEELTAWGKVAYRKKDNSFIPMLTDGTSLEGYVFKEHTRFGPKGTSFRPYFAGLPFFWAYTTAYRTTGDEFIWQMARDIGIGNNFGDIGESPKHKAKLKVDTTCSDVFGLIGFLELYNRTNKSGLLQIARRIGDNIVQNHFFKGFFVSSKKHTYTRFDSFEALALLHLYAAMESKIELVPYIWPSSPLFIPPYRYKEKPIDRQLIYRLTELSEPPMSLQEAAGIGDIDLLRSLIKKGSDIDRREDPIFKTALHRAAIGGYKGVAELLLAKGADVSARDQFPFATPLHYAAERGHMEVAELLIARGADLNAKRGYPADDRPLHSAVRAGRKDVVELLVRKGADVNAKNKEDQTPLDVALQRNRKDIVDLLIAKSADVSIHTAARYGLLKKLKELVSKGSNVNAKNNAGETALDVAIQEYRQDIAKLLVDKGADVSIHAAAFISDINKVEAFVEGGGSVDKADASGQTPLHYATAGNHKAIAELLISHGADVNALAGTWRTPLGVAARTGGVDVAEFLIAQGANVDGREGHWSPLQEAAYYSKEMVELLLAHGADINAGKWTALYSALDAERFDIVELLLAKGADVNIKDDKGRTPLHIAAWYAAHDNPMIVELLLSKEAEVNEKDNSGKTALMYAVEGGYIEIIELLKKHGAKE